MPVKRPRMMETEASEAEEGAAAVVAAVAVAEAAAAAAAAAATAAATPAGKPRPGRHWFADRTDESRIRYRVAR